MKINFFVPGEEEINFIRRFIWKYLPIELDRLENHIKGVTGMELEREELHRSLGVLLALMGCKTLLPIWNEPPIHL